MLQETGACMPLFVLPVAISSCLLWFFLCQGVLVLYENLPNIDRITAFQIQLEVCILTRSMGPVEHIGVCQSFSSTSLLLCQWIW